MFGKEGTFGSAATRDKYFGVLQSFNFTESNNNILVKSIGLRVPTATIWGSYAVTGSVDFLVSDYAIFEYILGSVNGGNGKQSTPYIYPNTGTSYESGITTLPSLTIECGTKGTSDEGAIILGCKCSSATINFAVDAPVSMTTNWTGYKAYDVTSLTSYASPPSTPFTFVQGSITRSASSIGIVRRGSITITNNLAEIRGINSRLLTDIYPASLDITYDVEMIMDSAILTTLKVDYYGQTATSGPIAGTAGTNSGATYVFQTTDGGLKTTTLSLATATLNQMGRASDVGGGMKLVTFSGNAHSLTVTEKITAD